MKINTPFKLEFLTLKTNNFKDKKKAILQELKKLRTTGMTGKPYYKRGRKKYFPKEEGKLAHKIRKKND